MRRNKTYEQQIKYYSESGEYSSLAELFLYWFQCGDKAKDIQATYREGDKQCRKQVFTELREIANHEDFADLAYIFAFGED